MANTHALLQLKQRIKKDGKIICYTQNVTNN